MATTVELPGASAAEPPTSPELTPQKLHALGVLTPEHVDRICAEESHTQFLVGGLLPAKSIAIVAGDSTIGKSPLVMQLALAVAGAAPFLGMQTTQGRVLYFDLENFLTDCKAMRDALVRFLGIDNLGDNFLLVPESRFHLEELVSEIRPQLVVIDSIRSFRPEVTEKNATAGAWLKELRSLTRKHDCSIVLVHHLRKPARDAFPISLNSCPVSTWMHDMEGPRAFMNQTDVRIAVATGEIAALELKWTRRVHGDSPLVLLERIFDDDGDPTGYRQMTGVDLLSHERRQAWEKLPDEFSFKDAKHALGKSDAPTDNFLRECIQLQTLVKVRRGHYKKIPLHGPLTRNNSNEARMKEPKNNDLLIRCWGLKSTGR